MDTTVLKALTVLETLSRSREGRGVTELSQELGLTKANCHRLLRTLIGAGYAVQDDDTKRYRLSLRMWEIGVAALDRLDLTETVHPHLQVLADAADESVQLATMDGDSIVYVDKADSRHPLRATTQVGSRVPAYCVSTGKALLAFTEHSLDRLIYPLTAFTATTITTRARMEREVTAIRRAGYAVNRGEWREGIWGIAAPVRDGTGVPVAAVGVWGPEVRFRGPAVARLAGHVLDAAQIISVRLGYRGSESSSSKRKATAN
jgi:DNA-binding IclR family transcriptional regulator